MTENALEIRGLSKGYKGFRLKDVSFDVPAGSIMGLVGANGAGKTTVIKLILNLVRREAGEVRVFGMDNLAAEKAVKTRIGFVPETPGLVEDAKLRDIKAAVAPFYPKWNEAFFTKLAGEFGLPLDKKFKKLSHGTKMKFSLALALSHDADLLVLDEPTSGLDPVFRRELLERLSGVIQDERKAVLFSTHITTDLEPTADHITLLSRGAVVFSLPKDELRETWAVVRGGPELKDGAGRGLFRGFRESAVRHRSPDLDIPGVRTAFPSGVVIEKASIEDVMVFMDQEACHA